MAIMSVHSFLAPWPWLKMVLFLRVVETLHELEGEMMVFVQVMTHDYTRIGLEKGSDILKLMKGLLYGLSRPILFSSYIEKEILLF